MKYTILEEEELAKLEKEFIQFLIINGIAAEDWLSIQKDAPRAQALLESFSDVVWEGVLQKARFVILRMDQVLFAFSFGLEEAQLFIATSKNGPMEIENWMQVDLDRLDFQSKPYKKERSQEIFEILQRGGLISDGREYRHLAMKWAEWQDKLLT